MGARNVAGTAQRGAAAARQAGNSDAFAAAPVTQPREKTDIMPSLNTTRSVDPTSRTAYSSDSDRQGRGRGRMALTIGLIAVLLVLIAGVIVAYNFLQPKEELITVPNVVKMTKEDASRTLSDAGLTVGEAQEENSETVPAGQVIRQDPAASAKVAKDTKVNLWISKGSGKVEVPNLRNMSTADAEKLLADLGLAYGFGQNKPDAEIEAGRVCGQNPAAGQMVETGTKVIYDVSSGPDSVPIPNVYGMPKADAEQTLRNSGFEVAYAEDIFSTSVAEGSVANQDKTGTGQKGDVITLTLSKGAEPEPTPQVAVPNVVGMTLQAASNQMAAVGLVLDYSGAPDATQTIIAQNPGAGVKVDKGSYIKVTFSDPE
jgi:serine/threonine-protein kinase